jgi:hypothetical protein
MRRRKQVLATLTIVGSAVLLSCSESSGPKNNPIPVLLSVTPPQLVLGLPGVTVKVSGRAFVANSQVLWNDQNRPTVYTSDSTLSVSLTATDLVFGTYQLKVYNPPPEGGTSAPLPVVVGTPLPSLTAVAPAAGIVGGPTVVSIITGSGFIPDTQVAWDGQLIGRTYLSPTEIRITLMGGLLTPGVHRITTINPAPGGGTSNAVEFFVSNPVPRIDALGPDTALIGSAFTLTVTGSRFVSNSVVRWNGSDRPTTFINNSKVTAEISADDVSTSTVATISVSNPAPGGGVSAGLPLTVRAATPSITSVSPATITAGSGEATLTVTGTNLAVGSVALWNSQPRPTSFVSSTVLKFTLSASDLITPSTGMVSVLSSGSGAASNAIAVTIVAPGLTASVVASVVLENNDVVGDPLRSVVYASIPATSSIHPNSIVRLDPTTGSITGAVVVGAQPRQIALSDDARYLYVIVGNSGSVARVDLASFTKDLEFVVGAGLLAAKLVVLAESPRSVVVVRATTCCSSDGGAAVYDDGVPRPKVAGGVRIIVRGPTPGRLYGYNNWSTGHEFSSVVVTPEGLVVETAKEGLVTGFHQFDFAYDGGFVFTSSRAVIAVPAMLRIGTIPGGDEAPVRPDASKGRVHFFFGPNLSTFHYTSFASIGTFSSAAIDGHTRFDRWGSDGIVVGGGQSIVFVRGSLIGP